MTIKICTICRIPFFTYYKSQLLCSRKCFGFYKRTQIPKNIRLNKELSYILGVICGDGEATQYPKSTFRIGLTTIDKDFVETFSKCIESVFRLKPKIQLMKLGMKNIRGKMYYCKPQFRATLHSKSIWENIAKYGTFGTFEWEVPNQILQDKDESIICSFLKGFIDSEGTINKYSLEIASKNLNGLKQIIKLLEQIGLRRIHIYKDWKDVWKVIAAGKDNLFIYHKKVGFSIKRKQERLENSIKYKYHNDTSKYWNVLNLGTSGHGYREISKLTGIPKWTVRDWCEGRYIPRSIGRELAVDKSPDNWEILANKYSFLNFVSNKHGHISEESVS